ncbi:MAG: uracil-DNA glycosylase [Phycisphaerales bacterium]
MSAHAPQADRAARIVAQHARTSALLGVDFVPVYTDRPITTREDVASLAPQRPVRVEAPEAAPPASISQAPVAGEVRLSDTSPETREEAQRLLDLLKERYETDAPHQHFVTDHNKIVFGEGDPKARLMFVGEAPGADEDRTGRPFVGRAGQLLEKMIEAMGMRREDVYICNVLKTRPPNNQTPTMEEARLCEPYLREQIRIVGPEAIVTLGLPATRLLLQTSASMRDMRGRWSEYPPRPEFEAGAGAMFDASEGAMRIPVMPTYHPAFLLRSYTPENRSKVWSDLRKVMDRLGLGKASPDA